MKRIKFPRIFHVPFSEKLSSDDKRLDDLSCLKDENIVITEKYDGENTTIYSDGYVHARSMDYNKHPGRTYVSSLAARLNGQIPTGWRVCGENLQARHTIPYYNLNDWFLVFAIFNERNHCLSWDDTKEWTRILDLHHVKELGRFLSGNPEKYIRDTVALHRSQSIEGFVIRNIDTFPFEDWSDNVAKFVYKHFEVPEEHWMHKEVVFNGRSYTTDSSVGSKI